MSLILNIRGTSGSGKSYIVHKLMQDASGSAKILDVVGKTIAHRLQFEEGSKPLHVLGKYDVKCGGCDTIKTQDQVCDLVKRFSAEGEVVFEGLLISHLYSRYFKLDSQLSAIGHKYIWAFLDTPLELCLERVNKRRRERGQLGDVNPKNTTQKWHDMRRVYKKCIDASLDARWIEYESAYEEVLSLINEQE